MPECQVCYSEVGWGPSGLGILSHSRKHRREFEEKYGREPVDYEEVRELLGSKSRAAADAAPQTALDTFS
jgi:hypothetical protein